MGPGTNGRFSVYRRLAIRASLAPSAGLSFEGASGLDAVWPDCAPEGTSAAERLALERLTQAVVAVRNFLVFGTRAKQSEVVVFLKKTFAQQREFHAAHRTYSEEEVEALQTTSMVLAEMIASGELSALARPAFAASSSAFETAFIWLVYNWP